MTEIDTSREVVERPCPKCGVTLNGYSGLRHFGTYTAHHEDDCIRHLKARAEKAEAARDAAWNDAIEAAADVVLYETMDPNTPARTTDPIDVFDAIRALRKGADDD